MNDDKKVISFEEYRRRRGKTTAAGPNEGALIGLFNRDLSEQKTLIEWYGFQEAVNRYKFFLMSLFMDNHEVADEINPNAGFIVCFSGKQIKDATESVAKEISALNRTHLILDAAGKSLAAMAEDLSGARHRTHYDAFQEFERTLLHSDTVLIVKAISRAKVKDRAGLARSLVKIGDDAHFKGIRPRSDLIFIDYAEFLQKSWDEIGIYVKIGHAR